MNSVLGSWGTVQERSWRWWERSGEGQRMHGLAEWEYMVFLGDSILLSNARVYRWKWDSCQIMLGPESQLGRMIWILSYGWWETTKWFSLLFTEGFTYQNVQSYNFEKSQCSSLKGGLRGRGGSTVPVWNWSGSLLTWELESRQWQWCLRGRDLRDI